MFQRNELRVERRRWRRRGEQSMAKDKERMAEAGELEKEKKRIHHCSSESEKPRQRVSNADRKVFANPESFCNKLIIG